MTAAKFVFVSELTSLQKKPPNPRVDSPLRKQFKIPSIRRIPVKTYKIGTVAKETGFSVKAIRFYEMVKLLPPNCFNVVYIINSSSFELAQAAL